MEKENWEKSAAVNRIAFNRIYKEMDIMYHRYAKKFGLSDVAFWILYSMEENEKLFTQRELCREWSFPPQTVNSALKDLEKKNIILLEPVPGNKKNKWIKLTEEGKAMVEEVILPLMRIEEESFMDLTDAERDIMLTATQKYLFVLCEKINRIE